MNEWYLVFHRFFFVYKYYAKVGNTICKLLLFLIVSALILTSRSFEQVPAPVITPGNATICEGSIQPFYAGSSSANNITWSPVTDVYTDAAATLPYNGEVLSTIYVKPATAGLKVYTATATDASGSSNSTDVTLNVKPSPQVSVTADFCVVPHKIRLTANSTPAGNTYTWSTGETTAYIDVDIANVYSVVATTTGGCSATASNNVAEELVTNGSFTDGNNAFISDYNYKPDGSGNAELVSDTGNNGYSITTDGQNVHSNFWGQDHTTNTEGPRNFMAVNGHGNTLTIWKETVNVLPNTTYYFSAWAMSMNSAGNNAQLRFSVNDILVGTTAVLSDHCENCTTGNANDNWIRFYGNWTSGPKTTSADIYINDLQAELTGNDFGLDDISFATLSPFIKLISPPGTDTQMVCINSAIEPIVYSIGNTASVPTVSGLPAGLTASYSGTNFTISGTPASSGSYSYTVSTTGSCNPVTSNGLITIKNLPAGGVVNSVASCIGASGTLNLSGQTGNILQWEDSTFSNPIWNVLPNTSMAQSFTNILEPTFYRAKISDGCGSAYSSIGALQIHNYWMGKTSNDWNTASNWSDKQIPSLSCPDVYIPGGTVFQPILSNGTESINNIHINGNTSVTVNGSGNMQIAGSIFNNGIFDLSNGNVEFNGSTPQTIDANTFLNNNIKNLIISNNEGVTLNGPVDVYTSLAYGLNGAILNTNDYLTLKSTVNETAWIGDMTGHIINGDVTVERYINTGLATSEHHKSWQLMAIPTSGNQTIKQAWQDSAASANEVRYSSYGTQITSNVAGATMQPNPGFDAASASPSMKIYNSVTDNYDGVASTAIPIFNAKGYFTFIRGDRTVTGINDPATATVLRSKGKLFTPANPPLATTVGPTQFASVGNPYASAIDLRKLSFVSGINTSVIVWDPTLTTGSVYGYGAFQTLFLSGGNYVNLLSSPTYGPVGSINNFIQSGQAFFIQGVVLNPGGGTLTFKEADKVSGSAVVTSPNPAAGNQKILRTNLEGVNADGSIVLLDGILNEFNSGYNNGIDEMDVKKIVNTGENLSIANSGKALVIERRNDVSANDTIFLNLSRVKFQQYRFSFDVENLGAGVQAFLADDYLHTKTALNNAGSTIVNFNIANVAGSYSANRFKIVFTTLNTLPVTFTSVKAYKHNEDINVTWKVQNETGIKQYDVEKSTDGLLFTKIATARAINNGSVASYIVSDINPVDGYNYYRIRSLDNNGKVAYTSVVKVLISSGKPNLFVYPNPVTDNIIHLQFINEPAGMYGIRLLTKTGQLISLQKIQHSEGNSTENIKWNFNVAHGIYELHIIKPGGSAQDINVLY